MAFLDKFLAPFQTLMKSTVESYVRLETADDEQTFAAKDGSLVTVLKVEGSRSRAAWYKRELFSYINRYRS